jgi:anti-sigma B factor antagonist
VAELCVTTVIVGDECVLTLAGEIDISCAEQIGDLAVGTLESHCIRLLALDMSAVTFVDSSGMGALVRMFQEAKAQGKGLSVRNPSEPVLKLLRLSALDTVLQLETAGKVLHPSGK